MDATPKNPQSGQVPHEVEQRVLKLFEKHGWSVAILQGGSCTKLSASRGTESVRIAVLSSSSAISSIECQRLATQVDGFFFCEQPLMLNSAVSTVTIPAEPLREFFPFLLNLNKRIEPDKSPTATPPRPKIVKRLVAESPLQSVLSRLEQFTSANLAAKLVTKRTTAEGKILPEEVTSSKATGIAYLMRNALDYAFSSPTEQLNKRVVSLYYGTMALAQAEMLASPSGPSDLDAIEDMTKFGHGLYTVADPKEGFAALRVGVLASGFLSEWARFLGQDTSKYPSRKARKIDELKQVPENMTCSLRELFASMPEIDDLFAEVFGGPSKWITAIHDQQRNDFFYLNTYKPKQKPESTYGH